MKPNPNGTQCIQEPNFNSCMANACDWNKEIIDSTDGTCK